jgi:ketosteroid isomerase-like protein
MAMVPVSVRAESQKQEFTNRVTSILADLATDEEDAVDRLMRIHQAMKAAKRMQKAIPANLLQDWTQVTTPALAAQAARIVARTRVMDRLNPPFNVVISNVPGPRESLYLAGAELQTYYPVSAVAEGQGLNITVQSYRDHLDFGLIACRELVPDVWRFEALFREALEELGERVPVPKREERTATKRKERTPKREERATRRRRSGGTMSILDRYQAYAEAFEQSYEDDDWSRIADYFTENAVYEGEPDARGRDAVLAKLQGGVDAFDRKMDSRTPDFQTPTVDGDTLTMRWTVTYTKAGCPDLVISGVETAVFEDDRIALLRDSFDPEAQKALGEWMAEHGAKLQR